MEEYVPENPPVNPRTVMVNGKEMSFDDFLMTMNRHERRKFMARLKKSQESRKNILTPADRHPVKVVENET